MGDNGDGSGSTPAAMYVILSFLFQILLQFLFVVMAVDLISMSTVLVDHMISLIFVPDMSCFLFLWIKSYAKLLIYSTIYSWKATTRSVVGSSEERTTRRSTMDYVGSDW